MSATGRLRSNLAGDAYLCVGRRRVRRIHVIRGRLALLQFSSTIQQPNMRGRTRRAQHTNKTTDRRKPEHAIPAQDAHRERRLEGPCRGAPSLRRSRSGGRRWRHREVLVILGRRGGRGGRRGRRGRGRGRGDGVWSAPRRAAIERGGLSAGRPPPHRRGTGAAHRAQRDTYSYTRESEKKHAVLQSVQRYW